MLTQVIALGATQTIAWAASTYLIAILAAPIARDLGIATSTVFGAFSVALVVMGLAGPVAGRAIDRWGGRGVLALSNMVLATGLMLLGSASDTTMLFISWGVLGFGMALGLYEAAFATLVRLYGTRSRGPITGITLIAGFASTVGWPVTAFLAEHFGWRMTCYAWGASHILIALPLNLALIPKAPPRQVDFGDAAEGENASRARPRTWNNYWRSFYLLALFGAMTAYVTSAMAAHLPGLLIAVGTTSIAALSAAALLGPAQVASRLIEFLAARRFRFHPLLTARIATAFHPVGAALLALMGGPAHVASLFAVLHGAGNGMITIAKGTLPLAIFGPVGYGHRQGLLSMLGRGMQAIAPYTFGLVLEARGPRTALALSLGLSIIALAALIGLRRTPEHR